MQPDRYEQALTENPNLYVHPLHMKPGRCENRHFKMEKFEPETKTEPENVQSAASRAARSNTPNLRYASSSRKTSSLNETEMDDDLFLDADTGFNEHEE